MTMRAGEVYEHPFERLVVRVGTAESDGRELVADLYVRAHDQRLVSRRGRTDSRTRRDPARPAEHGPRLAAGG